MDGAKPESLYQVFHQVIRLHFHRIHMLLEPLGVYPGQPPLLFALDRQDGQSQKELADRLHIQPATVTVMLRRMEASGLIERRQDAKDLRVVRVFLSERGRELCREARETMKGVEHDCFGGLQEEEREQLRMLMVRIRDNLLQTDGKMLQSVYEVCGVEKKEGEP